MGRVCDLAVYAGLDNSRIHGVRRRQVFDSAALYRSRSLLEVDIATVSFIRNPAVGLDVFRAFRGSFKTRPSDEHRFASRLTSIGDPLCGWRCGTGLAQALIYLDESDGGYQRSAGPVWLLSGSNAAHSRSLCFPASD